jgi:hypothetical protein
VDGGQASGGKYNLVFTDFDGTQFLTADFALVTTGTAAANTANAAAVKGALEALPNGVTGAVVVVSKGGHATNAKVQTRVSVKFSGKSGNVPPMVLKAAGGKKAYLFQPGQPTHTFEITASPASKLFAAQLRPSDSSLAPVLTDRALTTNGGKWLYWTTPDSAAAALTTASPLVDDTVAAGVAAALNAVPMIDFAYRGYFQADANVIVTSTSNSAPFTVTVAFPDAITGALPFRYGVATTVTSFPDESVLSKYDSTATPLVPDNVNGNYEAVTCSNRGLCDYGTGLCKCFAGHTGVDCSQQSALARGDSAGKA